MPPPSLLLEGTIVVSLSAPVGFKRRKGDESGECFQTVYIMTAATKITTTEVLLFLHTNRIKRWPSRPTRDMLVALRAN